jgi:hypothetical protein
MMGKFTRGASVKLHSVLQQIILGAGIGIASDALVEISRMPILNDTGTFGSSKISNFELFFYGISTAGIAAAIVDIGWGKGVLTFSRSMIFYLVGLIIGVYFYENTLATMFKIRQFNPYSTVGQYIPGVLPSNTNLPFITSNPLGGNTVPLPTAPTMPSKAALARI